VIREDDEASVAVSRHAVDVDPDSAFPRVYLAIAYADAGQLPEANNARQSIMAIERHFSIDRWSVDSLPFGDSSIGERLMRLLLPSKLLN
jgi:hypothetical protein